MRNAQFVFMGDLNDFLPNNRKGKPFWHTFEAHQSIKHLIESLGIPHTEIRRILINGKIADFSALLQDGDQVEVFPAATFIEEPGAGLQDIPIIEPRFVLDNHLGKLAVYLRILGFDCLYSNNYQDSELVLVASQDGRILLTRDRRLLMHRAVRHGYCLRTLDPHTQVLEVVRRFDLIAQVKPLQRCLRCNNPLQPINKETILDRLEPKTRMYYDEFHLCPACDQVYWKGSHYERMLKFIGNLINKPNRSAIE